ncbi:MAG: hypothetical protein ACTSPQ_16130 [Candidatus Helarchaeota archaeon]
MYKRNKFCKLINVLLFILIVFGIIYTLSMISNNSWKQLNSNLLIDKKTSTDMNNPEILYDNNAIYENYDNLSAEYYYKGTSYADYYYQFIFIRRFTLYKFDKKIRNSYTS